MAFLNIAAFLNLPETLHDLSIFSKLLILNRISLKSLEISKVEFCDLLRMHLSIRLLAGLVYVS